MQRKFVDSSVVADGTLGPRQIRVIASTAAVDRQGDIVEPRGCDVTNYRRNPVVLFGHDAARPIGTAEVSVQPNCVVAEITFAPLGASSDADLVCALAKAGILRSVSVGFRPVEVEPLGRGSGVRFVKWELLEISMVSIPANQEALVVARSMYSRSTGSLIGAETMIARLNDRLTKSAICHAAGMELMQKSARHLAKAQEHASAISSNSDDEDGDDDGDDVELATINYERKRAAIAQDRRRVALALVELHPNTNVYVDHEVDAIERQKQARMRDLQILALGPSA